MSATPHEDLAERLEALYDTPSHDLISARLEEMDRENLQVFNDMSADPDVEPQAVVQAMEHTGWGGHPLAKSVRNQYNLPDEYDYRQEHLIESLSGKGASFTLVFPAKSAIRSVRSARARFDLEKGDAADDGSGTETNKSPAPEATNDSAPEKKPDATEDAPSDDDDA